MYKILVADDSDDLLIMVSVLLENAGHEVTTTSDPVQVVGLLEGALASPEPREGRAMLPACAPTRSSPR